MVRDAFADVARTILHSSLVEGVAAALQTDVKLGLNGQQLSAEAVSVGTDV
jgi:hypothetical protein